MSEPLRGAGPPTAGLRASNAVEPPFYSDEELDALYERDPVEAMRISRRQTLLARELAAASTIASGSPAPTQEALIELLVQARNVLRRDGGDIEYVAWEDDILWVRLSGNCAGCPRAALDLKHVVERLIRTRFPQVRAVRNVGRLAQVESASR